VDPKCCTSQADCDAVKLALGTTCGAGLKCERHQCVKATPDKPDDDPLAKLPPRGDPDDPAGKPTTEVGAFNDDARGFAETTTGDEFSQGLAADFHAVFEFPATLSATTPATGCLHILADGKVAKWKIDPRSDNEPLNESMELALKKIEELRNKDPKPVPTYLLKAITTQWRCFKSTSLERQR
jgi:hypothetical protein